MISRVSLPSLATTTLACRSFAAAASANLQAASETAARPSLSSELFDDARMRVYGEGRTVDKVLVTVAEPDGHRKDYLLNRNVSTALTCAKHISSNVISQSALARVTYESGNSEFVSLNLPLTHKSELEFVNFNTANKEYAIEVNEAYWRSASVVLAAVLKRGLQLDVETIPKPGSFTDKPAFFSVEVKGAGAWDPSKDELADLARFARREFIENGISFDFITVPEDVAAEYGFDTSVNLCRLGDHVSVVDGPTIVNTNQIGRFSIVKALARNGLLHFAGTSVPACQKCSSYSWDLITKHAEKQFK